MANTTNRGFAAANNQGIEVAQGRYVLLLNSDTLVLDGAIDKMVAFAEQHPEAAAVACRVLNRDRTWQPTSFMFPSALNLLLGALYLNKVFPHNRFCGRERMTWWDGQEERAVDVVAGCFILVRRDIIEQVGVLDESYFMYGEESDWCYRFHKAGWKVLYTPAAHIVHLGGASSARVKGPMCLQLRASTLLFLRKHTSFASYVTACILVSLFFLLRLPLWLVKAATSGKARTEHWQTARHLCGRVLAGTAGVAGPVREEMNDDNYVLITPAYNEGRFIGKTIEGVLAQTRLPRRWVIVDDGSTDDTGQIIRRYAQQAGFIEGCQRRRDANETYYGNNVYALLQGYDRVKELDFDYLGILDADMILGPRYYEEIFQRFEANPSWGSRPGPTSRRLAAAGGSVHRPASTPKALQVFRRACYEQIGGYVPCPNGGEDTYTEIMARMHGWQTWSFPEIQALHQKPVGTGDGKSLLRAKFRQGVTDYCLGTHPFFMLAKCLRRCLRERPYGGAGLARLAGFVHACLVRERRQILNDARRYVRREQMTRLRASVGLGPRLWQPRPSGQGE